MVPIAEAFGLQHPGLVALHEEKLIKKHLLSQAEFETIMK